MEKKKNNFLVKILVVVGFITGILALIMSFLPLNLISFAPATIAVISGGVALIIAKRTKGKIKGSIAVLSIAILSMLIGGISEIAYENAVDQDEEFLIATEASIDSVDADLLEALEELDGIVDESEEFIEEEL